MRIGWRAAAVAMAALVLLGCPAEKPVEPPDAATEAPVDAGVAEVIDAGPPAPLRLEFAVTARRDGGEDLLAFSEDATEIDPATGFTLTTPVRLKDYRVRLFDWNDQVVPSDDTAELADGGLTYRIDLAAPLKTGRRYSLLVDAELAPQIDDEAGRHYDDVRMELKVRGDVVPDKPAKKSKRKSK